MGSLLSAAALLAFASVTSFAALGTRAAVPGGGLHSASPAVAALPPGIQSAPLSPALSPGLATTLLAPPAAQPEPRRLPVLSFEQAKDVSARAMAAAGIPQLVREEGLVLWRVLRWQGRSGGERAALTFSLPSDGRPYGRGRGDPERRAELSRRLERSKGRILEAAARALGIDAGDILLDERLIETCCGAGCQGCLLVEPEHAAQWTGQPPRERR